MRGKWLAGWACALLAACGAPVQSSDAAVAPTDVLLDQTDVFFADSAQTDVLLDQTDVFFADSAQTDAFLDKTDVLSDVEDILVTQTDVLLDQTDVLPDVSPPVLTLATLQAALQADDPLLAAPLTALYDMPVCDATQCLFLVVAPGVQAVAVTGDWAQWTTDTALAHAPKMDVWWAVIPLQVVAKVEYKVKLDGQWSLDPSNPHFAWNTYGPNSAIYGKNHSRLRRFANVESPQLANTRDVYVYVPAAYYQDETLHLPVLYMQDGFNVFTNPKAPFGSWDVEQTADALMASGEVQPVIIVGIDTADRNHEYVYAPLNINGTLYDPKLPQYTDFLVNTLKPLIDKTLRTLPDRLHTAMGGSSLGGISSMWIGWTHWQTFGLVASFSGAYWIGESGAVWNGGKSSAGPAMRTLIASKTDAPPLGSLRIYLDSGDTGFDGVASYDGDAWEYSDWTRNALITAGWDTRTEWQPPTNLPKTTTVAKVPSLAWTATPAQGWKAYVQPEKNLFDCVGHGHQHNEAAWKQRFGAMLRFLWPGVGLK